MKRIILAVAIAVALSACQPAPPDTCPAPGGRLLCYVGLPDAHGDQAIWSVVDDHVPHGTHEVPCPKR